MPASQDFRDGMASGARLLRDNIAIARSMGLDLDRHDIAAMAANITEIYGGNSRADLQDDEE